MPDRVAVDVAGAEAFLRDHLHGIVREVAPIGNGEWSDAFSFTCDGDDFVVRFAPILDDFANDHHAVRFSSPDLPIPALVEIGEVYDGFFAISERAFGTYLESLDDVAMEAVFPAVLRALDAARAADVSATTGYGSWRHDGSGAFASWRDLLLDVGTDEPGGRMQGWRAELAARPDAEAGFDRAFSWLASHADASPGVRHVIHNDLLHGNVLVDGGRITAVFDWGCAMYGDFLYDVALLHFWSAWYPPLERLDVRSRVARHLADQGVAVDDYDARIAVCAVHLGLGNLVYQAYRGFWDDYAWTARRIEEVIAAAG